MTDLDWYVHITWNSCLEEVITTYCTILSISICTPCHYFFNIQAKIALWDWVMDIVYNCINWACLFIIDDKEAKKKDETKWCVFCGTPCMQTDQLLKTVK